MSTSEHFATYTYRCPHGTGEYIDEWWIPDHGYSPRPYRKDTSCTCAECARAYEADFGDGVVRLTERVELERRRAADSVVSLARERIAPIERTLQERAIGQLELLTGSPRYRLAAKMLRFTDDREAMDFAKRRRVPTWVPDALRDRDRKAALASHYGQDAVWQTLREEYEHAKAARMAMGEAPVCHVLRR